MEMLIITGLWMVILIGIFVIGLAIDKLITKIFDKVVEDGNNN